MKYQSIIIETNQYKLSPSDIAKILQKEFSKEIFISNTNIFEVNKPEGKNSIGIGDIGAINEWAFMKHDLDRFIIINNSEKLTEEAQNSLLKLIEEPSENVQIILITQNPSALLQTIVSRCLLVTFNENKTNLSSEIFETSVKFLASKYLERLAIIDRIASSEWGREEVELFITGLIKANFDNEINKPAHEIFKKAYKANKRGVNTKLLLDYININLNY